MPRAFIAARNGLPSARKLLMALLGDRHGLLDQAEPPGCVGHGMQVIRGQ